MQVGDILKKSSNRGAILIRRNLDCEDEFKVDLDQIGLLKSVKVGFGMYSVEPTVNNFRGSYCDNIPFGYGLSISPIQLINAYGKIITGRDSFRVSFEKSKNSDIFDEFVRLHKKSKGEKGKYMTETVVDFYRSLIEQENWYIYYINYNDSMISSAFVYESEIVDYLYNSCRDHSLEEFNTGTYLNDQLLQNSINNKKRYFDYLKGDEKYKFYFGGQVHQLYDLKIKV